MKLRVIVKIAVISSVVLLCAAIGVFSYFKLTAAENREEFNLYTLVPQSAVTVFETDDLAGLINGINELSCSKDHHFLYVSKLFSYLKSHIHSILDETPHGLSKQMNQVLLSFHEPDNDRNQVLYCSLGEDDYRLVEKFIQKYCSSSFPSKLFNYKGEEIRIYPLLSDGFLACYITSDFLVVSYQKKLIEEVIDARLSGNSLLEEPVFRSMHSDKRNKVSATIYTRMQSLSMGKQTDGLRTRTSLGGWTEFDMRMNGDAIYFSGISHDEDTCLTFMNVLRKQEAVEGFPGDILPAGTFSFSKRSANNWQAVFDFTACQEYATATYSDYIKDRDGELFGYLKENTVGEVVTCLFQPTDTLKEPAAVMSFPIRDITVAERMLQSFVEAAPKEEKASSAPSKVLCYTPAKAYSFYVLPRNTLFAQLTGIVTPDLYTYACFYNGRLLLAPDARSLSSYIHYLEKGEVLDGSRAYEEGISSLTSTYHFMMMTDLSDMLSQPEEYVRLVPEFFFRNQDFFRYFILSVQFTCTDGIVYPNIVLLYKGG